MFFVIEFVDSKVFLPPSLNDTILRRPMNKNLQNIIESSRYITENNPLAIKVDITAFFTKDILSLTWLR